MKIAQNFKKGIATSFLVVCLAASSNANAIPVEDWMNSAAQYGEFAEGIVQTAYQGLISVKTTIMEALEKASWVQQLKSMYQTYENAVDAKEKLTSEITGLTDVSTLITDVINPAAGDKNAVFAYASEAPDKYVPSYNCTDDGHCTANPGNGFKGVASGITSEHIRDTYKATPRAQGATIFGIPLAAIFPKSMELKYAEVAETNAQQIAVINAMALEAYTQSNNRIAKITELRELIAKVEAAPAGADKTNNLKRVADLQAQIQSYGINLQNEQTKLASLAILQQSQKDGYEQHKREIMLTAFRTPADEAASGIIPGISSESIKRGLVLGASWGALQAMASGTDPADPNNVASTPTVFGVNPPAGIVAGGTIKTTMDNAKLAINNQQGVSAANLSLARLQNANAANAAIAAANAANIAEFNYKNNVIDPQVAADRAIHLAALSANANTGAANVGQVKGSLDTAEADGKAAGTQDNSAAKTSSQPVGTAGVDHLRNQGQQAGTTAANNLSLNSAATAQAIANNTAALNALVNQLASQPAP